MVFADAPYHPPVEPHCPYTDIPPEELPAESNLKIKMVDGVYRVYEDDEQKEK